MPENKHNAPRTSPFRSDSNWGDLLFKKQKASSKFGDLFGWQKQFHHPRNSLLSRRCFSSTLINPFQKLQAVLF
jgi:hypothetical protein